MFCWQSSLLDEDAPELVKSDYAAVSSCLQQLLGDEDNSNEHHENVHHNYGLDEFGFFQDSFVHGGGFERVFNVRNRIN